MSHTKKLFFKALPLRPLLVQHAMAAHVATNHVALGQLDFRGAVAADVLYEGPRGAFAGGGACCECAAGLGGELVGLRGHYGGLSVWILRVFLAGWKMRFLVSQGLVER